MMKEFVDKLSYEDLEKLELLVVETKRKKDKDFVTELMDNVTNALSIVKTEMNRRFGDSHYVIFEINGYTHYFDEELTIEVRVEDKEDEYDPETLYYETL